jgi:HEAT repeat protein
MRSEFLAGNPRELVRHADAWSRRSALVAMLADPQPTDRELFEEILAGEDTTASLLAFLGLKKLLPAPLPMRKAWKSIFGESVELLVRRACSGPVQLRLAALKALAFAPEHLHPGLVEQVLQSLDEPVSYENIAAGQTPELALINNSQRFFLPEGFALLLASLPGGQERVRLLQRELYGTDPARLVPVLLALQISPVPELSDQLLVLARSAEPRVALEAARALAAGGSARVVMVLLSLLKEAADPARKAWLLPLVAASGREEVWPIIKTYAAGDERILQLAALQAAEIFAVPAEEKARLFKKAMASPDAAVCCKASACAWQFGSMQGLHQLEACLFGESKAHRQHAAHALSLVAPETAVIMLSSRFDVERSGDVVRQMILSMRKLLPALKNNSRIHELLMPWFKRLMHSTDAFKRSQCAVLCGILGRGAEELVLKTLEKEHHPHVIASLLGALGRIGSDRLLVYSRFNDHPDPRVRANMISAMLSCANGAVPYFAAALKDPAPRVRAAAARNLFLLGQLDIVAELNRMLLVPSPVSVLSGCYGLGQLLRIQPPTLQADHPLPLAVSRRVKANREKEAGGPDLLASPQLADLFKEMAIAGGNMKKLLWLVEEKCRRFPASHGLRRVHASLAINDGQYDKAAALLAQCLAEQPMILADLFDAYRLALKLGNLDAADSYGQQTRRLYAELLDGCMQLCRSIRGTGADMMLEKLHHLHEPSMNLYNAMIQLKVLEADRETVLELLAELVLARPLNVMVVRRLAGMLPESHSELRAALQVYLTSLG